MRRDPAGIVSARQTMSKAETLYGRVLGERQLRRYELGRNPITWNNGTRHDVR